MILSALKVLKLNDQLIKMGKKPLIENLCERELENPEGVGLDIRVGEVYLLEGIGFLEIKNRRTPNVEKIADIEEDKNEKIIMYPNNYFLVRTIEKVNVPDEKIVIEDGIPARYLMPVVYPRSTLQRCGVGLFATKTDPGYSGELTFGLKNFRDERFVFELGARMFNIIFEEVVGEIERAYSGQHQGGRTTSQGRVERQV